MPSANAVARELVLRSLSDEGPGRMTHKRLQKLLYFAQAWSMALRDSELYPEDVEAWPNGPVVLEVYEKLKQRPTGEQIDESAFCDVYALERDEAEFVRHFWDDYKRYSQEDLVAMTHREPAYLKAREASPEDKVRGDLLSMNEVRDYRERQELPSNLREYQQKKEARRKRAEENLLNAPPLDRWDPKIPDR